MEEDLVFKALASPLRRRILDRLRRSPATTGELTDTLPELSRFAVMQHLKVLESAGLILVRREGRQRFNHLNAVPIRQIYERWVSRFAEEEASKLVAVKRHLEGGKKDG